MKKVLFLLLCLTTIACRPPEKKVEEQPFDQLPQLIDQYANDVLQRQHVNSIAVAIYRDGDSYHNYYGEMDKNQNNPPHDSTLYEVASISKVFAGSLAAKAVLEGKLSLNDDIRKYLKGNYPNLEFQGIPVTIQNLLTHTIGFKNRIPERLAEINEKISQGHYENQSLDYDFNDFLEELKTVEINKQPGTFYEYNSIGPELVAYALEQVYNTSYKKLLTDFFKELGMNNTYLQEYEQHKTYLSNGYDSNGLLAPLDKNPLLGGGYGIITTLPDLMLFMKFQLESKDPLIKKSTKVLFEDNDNTMGYLWQDMSIGEKEGFYYSKTGTSHGVQSGLLICPDSDYGQIIIINNKSEAALNDWGYLFNKIETDLIHFPKINLMSLLKPLFLTNMEEAQQRFNILKKQDSNYFNTHLPKVLNTIGYDLLYFHENNEKAIAIFEFAVKQYPENANLYDSLGEAYFNNKEYGKALLNYKRSLEFNPNNENAKQYVSRIALILSSNPNETH